MRNVLILLVYLFRYTHILTSISIYFVYENNKKLITLTMFHNLNISKFFNITTNLFKKLSINFLFVKKKKTLHLHRKFYPLLKKDWFHITQPQSKVILVILSLSFLVWLFFSYMKIKNFNLKKVQNSNSQIKR